MRVAISGEVGERKLPDQIAARDRWGVAHRGERSEGAIRSEPIFVGGWTVLDLAAVFDREEAKLAGHSDAVESSDQQAGCAVGVQDKLIGGHIKAGLAGSVQEELFVLDKMGKLDRVELEDVAFARARSER